MKNAEQSEHEQRAEVGLCILLAVADGDISEREIAVLSTKLGALLGDDYPAVALGAVVDAELAAMEERGPNRYIASLVERIDVHRRAPALETALVVACADGLAPEEERMFRDVGAALGLPGPDVEAIFVRVRELLPASR